jgi:hypothetical protein
MFPDEGQAAAAELKAQVHALFLHAEIDSRSFVRASRVLIRFKVTTPEQLRNIGRNQLMREPNVGKKTVKAIAETILGGDTADHWAGRPITKSKLMTAGERLNAAKKQYSSLYQEHDKLLVQVDAMRRHLNDARDYNKRLHEGLKELSRSYERLRVATSTSVALTPDEIDVVLQLLGVMGMPKPDGSPDWRVMVKLNRARDAMQQLQSITQ